MRAVVDRLRDARHFLGEARQIAIGMDADIFEQVRYYHYAMRYCFIAAGEALRHVPADIRDLAPDLPWRAVINMRHRLAHDYWLTDSRIVLEAANQHIDPLIEGLDRLLVQVPAEP